MPGGGDRAWRSAGQRWSVAFTAGLGVSRSSDPRVAFARAPRTTATLGERRRRFSFVVTAGLCSTLLSFHRVSFTRERRTATRLRERHQTLFFAQRLS